MGASLSLIETRGYSAVGVAEICAAAGVPKGSFYYFFASKEDMALAVIEEHWKDQRKGWADILTRQAPPLERLRLLCEASEEDQRAGKESCGSVAGCLFGNLTLELSNQTEAVRLRLQAVFDDQATMVATVIADGLASGDIVVADPDTTARAVITQIEGQLMFAKLYNDTGRLGPLWENCLALLGARVPAGAEGWV